MKKRSASVFAENAQGDELYDNSAPRSGKWTTEEETLAKSLIANFESGSLKDCPEGCTLRCYLAQKLNCAPMRISKKFAGQCIGKQAFVRKEHSPGNAQFDSNPSTRARSSSDSEGSIESSPRRSSFPSSGAFSYTFSDYFSGSSTDEGGSVSSGSSGSSGSSPSLGTMNNKYQPMLPLQSHMKSASAASGGTLMGTIPLSQIQKAHHYSRMQRLHRNEIDDTNRSKVAGDSYTSFVPIEKVSPPNDQVGFDIDQGYVLQPQVTRQSPRDPYPYLPEAAASCLSHPHLLQPQDEEQQQQLLEMQGVQSQTQPYCQTQLQHGGLGLMRVMSSGSIRREAEEWRDVLSYFCGGEGGGGEVGNGGDCSYSVEESAFQQQQQPGIDSLNAFFF